MAEEQYDSLDSVLSGRISKVNESPRPARPDNVQQHQANLAVNASQEPGFMRGLGEMIVAPFGGYTPGLQPSNVRDLPIMKDYPLPSAAGQTLSNVGSFAKGAFQTGVKPLADLAGTAYNDITQSPWQEKGLKTFEHAITNPMQQTMEKGMDENLPAVEAAGHRGLSVLPVVGPWASDVLSNSLPKALFGQTGEERSAGAGEIAGPILAGKALHATGKATGRGYRNAGQKQLTKGYAEIANAADVPQELVESAYPYVDKFQKESRGVDYRGRPLASSIIKSGKRGIESMDMDSIADLSRHAEKDFHKQNIAPVEDQLNNTPIDAKHIAADAIQNMDTVYREVLTETPMPPQMRAIGRLLIKADKLKDLFDLRKSINGITKSMQAESRLNQSDFARKDPRGRFLSGVQNDIRSLIDNTIDVNAGRIGQTSEVLRTYSNLKELADGLEVGAERSARLETAKLGKRFGKLPAEVSAAGAAGGFWGSKARAISELAQSTRSSANMPNSLIPHAGKLIERRGNFGLTPSGRSAMFQPPDINWLPPFDPMNQTQTGPILGGPGPFNPSEPPQSPSEPFNIPPNYQAEPNPVQPSQGLNQVQAPQQLPQAPAQPPPTNIPPQVSLPQGQTPKALKAGTYNLGEGEFYDTIKKEAIRPPEGKIKPSRKPEEKLKVSESRSVRPKEGELNVKKSTEESGKEFNVSDKRSEFTAPRKFSTVPDRMQKQETRSETISRLSDRVKGKSSAPEQSSNQQQTTKEQPVIESKPAEQKSQPQVKAPKESKWEAKEAGKGMVDLYKNGVKMFDKPLPAAEAQKWISKRQSEEKNVRKFYDEGEKGAVNLTSDQETRFPEKLILPDGHEATRRQVADFGPDYQFMSYDVTKSHDKNYVGSTLYFDLNSKDPVKDFQAKIDEHPSLKIKPSNKS